MSSLESRSPGRQSPMPGMEMDMERESNGVQIQAAQGHSSSATGDIRRLVSYHHQDEAGSSLNNGNGANLKSRLSRGLNWATLKKNGSAADNARSAHDAQCQLASSLNNIGVILHETEQHEKALQHYQDAVQVRMAALRNAPDNDATGLQGEILATKCAQAEKAEVALQVRVTSQSREEARSSHASRRPLDLFPFCDSEGDFDSSIPFNVFKPFPIAKRERHQEPVHGGSPSSLADNRDSAITLYNMGLLYYNTGNLASAKKLFGMAQSILPGVSYPAFSAVLLNNVALVHYHEEKSAEAIQFLVEALRLQHQVAATGSLDGLSGLNLEETLVFTLSLMGRIYYEEGDSEQALEVLKECLRLRRGSLGDQHVDVAVTLHNIGLALHQTGDLNGAIEHCEWFISQARPSLATAETEAAGRLRRAEVATALHTLSKLHLENRSVTKAQAALVECLSLRRTILDEPTVRYDAARTFFDLGKMLQDQGSLVEALDKLREAQRLFRSVDGAEEDVATVSCMVGQIHQDRGDLDAALDAYEGVLTAARRLFGDRNEYVASILNVIGNLCLEMGETEDAVANFADARRIMDSLDGSSSGQSSPVVTHNPLQFLGADFHPCAAAA